MNYFSKHPVAAPLQVLAGAGIVATGAVMAPMAWRKSFTQTASTEIAARMHELRVDRHIDFGANIDPSISHLDGVAEIPCSLGYAVTMRFENGYAFYRAYGKPVMYLDEKQQKAFVDAGDVFKLGVPTSHTLNTKIGFSLQTDKFRLLEFGKGGTLRMAIPQLPPKATKNLHQGVSV